MADEVRRYELTSKTDLKNGLYSESLFSGLSLPNVGPNTRVYVRILTVSCFSVNLTICSLINIATRYLWRIFSTFLFSVLYETYPDVFGIRFAHNVGIDAYAVV